MENELWAKLEMFVATPLVNIAIPHYVNEMQNELTAEQLEPLGDLTEMLTKMFSEKSSTPAKEIIEHLIYLAKNGYIKKKP